MRKLFVLSIVALAIEIQPIEAQYVTNAPTKHNQVSAYRQQFTRASSTSSESSGQIDFFETEIVDKVTPSKTRSIPFVISDSYSRKSSSGNTTFIINNIFPKDSDETTSVDQNQGNIVQALDPETGLPLLAQLTKNLSNGTIEINVVPSKDKVPLTTTSATFSSAVTETFSLYAESNSPNFVNSFAKTVFNKNYLGK